MLRFEVTEEPSPGFDGERFMHVPGRGLFRATVGAAGDIMLGEDRVRASWSPARGPRGAGPRPGQALGTAWDAELEPYRHAGEGAPVTLLTQVG